MTLENKCLKSALKRPYFGGQNSGFTTDFGQILPRTKKRACNQIGESTVSNKAV